MKNNTKLKKKTLAVKDELLDCIIHGIREKKGKEIVMLDLQEIGNAICDQFIICQGDSSTQVNAIANSIEKEVKEQLNTNALHKEGFENAQWMILDFFSIVVHIFQPEARHHYNLEELWADASYQNIDDN